MTTDTTESLPDGMATLQWIPLGDVHESPLNPRRRYDQAKLDELASSLASGQITPCVVRPVSSGGYELAAGHRRRRAAELAGLEMLLCIVREMDDEEFLQVLTVENLQRDDLHPLDEAQGFAALMQLPGYDVETVAAKLGKSPSYVARRLMLSQLTPAAQEEFLGDRLLLGHALILARLQPKDQDAGLRYLDLDWAGDRPSVRGFAAWVRSQLVHDLRRAPFKTADAALVPAAGSCAACPKRTGHQRELLDDVELSNDNKSVDRCLDPSCFAAKVAAFVQLRRVKAAAKHETLLEVSSDWSADQRDSVLSRDQYWEVEEGDPGATAALVVTGAERIGKVMYVTTKRPGSGTPSGDDTEQARNRQQKAAQQRALARRQEIFAAVTPLLPTTLDAATLRLVIGRWDLRSDVARQLSAALGITPDKDDDGRPDFYAALDRAVAEFDVPRLIQYIQQLALAEDLIVWSHSQQQDADTQLIPRAVSLGVDVPGIDARTAAAARKKPKAMTKAAPAKASKKKRLAGDVRREKAAARAEAATS